MKYCMTHRVRYSEVDYNFEADLAQIINYFQDCSTFHSESIGYGVKFQTDRGRAWVLLNWQIEVGRFPKYGEDITIRTWGYDYKSVFAYRNFDILDGEGNQIVRAGSIWNNMDIHKQIPARLDPEEMEAYQIEEGLDMEYLPRKIKAPDIYEELASFPVVKAHLDTNQHVNNGQYVALAKEYLPEHYSPKKLQVYYKQAAVLHDIIYPRLSKEDDKYIIQLCKADGDPYAIVAFWD